MLEKGEGKRKRKYLTQLVRILAAVQDIVKVGSNIEAVDQSWSSP
jgi:hypothetical protein